MQFEWKSHNNYYNLSKDYETLLKLVNADIRIICIENDKICEMKRSCSHFIEIVIWDGEYMAYICTPDQKEEFIAYCKKVDLEYILPKNIQ